MKQKDMLIAGGVILAGIFVLPKILNIIGGGDGGGISSIIPDVIREGGTVETKTTNDLPWWTFLSPFSILTAYGTRGTDEYKFSGGKTNDSVVDQSAYRNSVSSQKPKDYYKMSKSNAIDKLTKAVSLKQPGSIKVASQILDDIPLTKTVDEGYLQPMTIARLESRIRYGTTGGR